MKKFVALALAAALAHQGLASAEEPAKTKAPVAVAAATPAAKPAPAASATEHAAATPGWVIIEDDFWVPLRFEPLASLNNVRYHYRRHEEKAAANEIRKSVSWLNLAAGKAMPETQAHLKQAAQELKTVADDLDAGKIDAAAHMDGALAKAAHSLAEWHFFRAKASWGKQEEKDAGYDLEMAANYLQHAVDSSHHQFGPDSQKVITEVFRNGKLVREKQKVEHNWVATDLEGVEKALKEVATSLHGKL